MTSGSLAQRTVRAGFIPLTDCAPLIVARELGFAREEELELALVRETSWATVRDRIAVRRLDVSHMLAAMPLASNLGLTPLPATLIAPIALGIGGNTVTVSRELWAELAGQGATPDLSATNAALAFADTVKARRKQSRPRIVLAVVHPYSAHRYILAYWLASAGIDPERDLEIVIVPPPLMADALGGRQIDGFSVGEPWGTVATLEGNGHILTTTAHIWQSSPDKVVGMRRDWAEENPDRVARLIRAVYRAAAWCDLPENTDQLAHLMARPEYLDRPVEAVSAGLRRRLATAGGSQVPIPGFLTYAAQAATFPWRSHALWFYAQMVRWGDAPLSRSHLDTVRDAFRPDLYREAVQPLGITVPSANAKMEGALETPTPVASPTGRLILGPDRFFDGGVFDPDHVAEYVASFPIRARPRPD
jgi:ABC-type nitrate/sulfonate/bicarbonate transport system substrate-binding protein